MRIVTLEQSIKEIENISSLKKIINKLFGFSCHVNNITFFTGKGEYLETKKYKMNIPHYTQN